MVKDILLDETGDLGVSVSGDLVVGISDDQHIDFIVSSDLGQWKQTPMIGVGIVKWVNAPVTPASIASLQKKVKVQLQYDGANVKNVDTDGNWNIRINAEYNEGN